MFQIAELKSFLLRSNMPHALGTSNVTTSEDHSHTITFEDGKWSMHDNFFGGEPYGGRQVLFFENRPVWMMVYYGKITSPDLAPIDIYNFLREALRYGTEERPYRGPESFVKGEFEYRSSISGEADNFSGSESILKNNEQIYWASFLGGLVDRRAQGEM